MNQIKANQIVIVLPDKLKWKADAELPGAYVAAVYNDSNKNEIYTKRLKLPPNFEYPPHSLSKDEYVTILSGSMHLGIGIKFDKNNGTFLPTGTSLLIPADLSHYAWTSEEGVIVEIYGKGPRTP